MLSLSALACPHDRGHCSHRPTGSVRQTAQRFVVYSRATYPLSNAFPARRITNGASTFAAYRGVSIRSCCLALSLFNSVRLSVI